MIFLLTTWLFDMIMIGIPSVSEVLPVVLEIETIETLLLVINSVSYV